MRCSLSKNTPPRVPRNSTIVTIHNSRTFYIANSAAVSFKKITVVFCIMLSQLSVTSHRFSLTHTVYTHGGKIRNILHNSHTVFFNASRFLAINFANVPARSVRSRADVFRTRRESIKKSVGPKKRSTTNFDELSISNPGGKGESPNVSPSPPNIPLYDLAAGIIRRRNRSRDRYIRVVLRN